jgi:hypothetical protein
MRRLAAITVVVGSMFLVSGCAALVGGAVGAGGTAGGYEIHLSNERERVQKDFDEGRIDRREYDIRIDQIRRDSAVQ